MSALIVLEHYIMTSVINIVERYMGLKDYNITSKIVVWLNFDGKINSLEYNYKEKFIQAMSTYSFSTIQELPYRIYNLPEGVFQCYDTNIALLNDVSLYDL